MAKKAAIVGALDLQSKADEVGQANKPPQIIGAFTRGKRRTVLTNYQKKSETVKKSKTEKGKKSQASADSFDSYEKKKPLVRKVSANSRKRKASDVSKNGCDETVKPKRTKVPVSKIEAGGSKKVVRSQRVKKAKTGNKKVPQKSGVGKGAKIKAEVKDVDADPENYVERDVVESSSKNKKSIRKSAKRKSQKNDEQSDDVNDTDKEEDNEAKNKVYGSFETLILKDEEVTKLSIICDCCSLSFPSLFKLKQHIKNKFKIKLNDIKLDRVFECLHEGCGKRFKNVTNCRKHLLTVHNPERKYTCEFCAFSFKTASSLKSHLIALHSKEGDFKFHCQVCDKRFRRKQGLNMHITVHSNEKNFVCSYDGCGKQFRLQSTLHKHELTVHLGDKPFECHICEERFTRGTYLKSHMYKHTGVKRYQCDVCYKSFTQNGNLMQHKRAIHGKKKKTYECHVCFQTFNFKSNLTKHLITKHDKNEQQGIHPVMMVNNFGVSEPGNRRKLKTTPPSRRSESRNKGIQVEPNPHKSVNKHIYLSFDKQEKFLIVNPGSKCGKNKTTVKVEAMSPNPAMDDDDKGQSSSSPSVDDEILDPNTDSENLQIFVVKDTTVENVDTEASNSEEPASSNTSEAQVVTSIITPQANTVDNLESNYPICSTSPVDVKDEVKSSEETDGKDDDAIVNERVSIHDGNICITYVASPSEITSQPAVEDSIVNEITESESTNEIKQLILKANEASDGPSDDTSIYITDANTSMINALEAILGTNREAQLLPENILSKPVGTNENAELRSTAFEDDSIPIIQNSADSFELPSNTVEQHVARFIENE
ncbi:GDNF-inducible zinc finger protein 1 [Mactra antiquata]